ncbi:RrF2 family transcriptional regulator [Teredinibacter purpureus]|uniref:RrF2 family transcriptional regulator n=1 Tax=Teredinibacter purpureus TaxID=2731756 RepID=UPI0005F7CF9C|nr:Rrf2 family transcriptional regulator [Teredinibacter purpureus]
MKIKRFTDYSLRVLIYLALKEDELVTIREVAERYQISKNHLMKVVQDLNSKGFLIATRGNSGGIRLSRSPEQINVGQLIRMIEQDSTLVECFGQDNQCVITPACQLKQVFAEAMESFFICLDQYTLADLVLKKHRASLQTLLTISATE